MAPATPTPTGRRRAELWVRSYAPAGIDRERHATRLEALVEEGLLADATVRTWDREVALSRTALRAAGSRVVLGRLAAFRARADRTGHDLSPFFATREADASITGETCTRQVLPLRALVEFENDRVVHVAPSVDPDGSQVTVRDRLDRLERGTGPGVDRPGTAGRPGTIPWRPRSTGQRPDRSGGRGETEPGTEDGPESGTETGVGRVADDDHGPPVEPGADR